MDTVSFLVTPSYFVPSTISRWLPWELVRWEQWYLSK